MRSKVKFLSYILLAACLVAAGCGPTAPSPESALNSAEFLAQSGDFAKASNMLSVALDAPNISNADRRRLEWERARLDRIKNDYSISEEDLINALSTSLSNFSRAEFARWDSQGWFDKRTIDGQVWYVDTSVANLFYRHPQLVARRIGGKNTVPQQKGRLADCRAIKAAARRTGKPIVLPHHYLCTMTITVHSNVVPPGQIISAWLPIPRAYPYQTDIKILRSSVPIKSLAPEDSPIRSAYLEQAASNGPTSISVTYSYTFWGVFYDPQPALARAADLKRPDLAPYVAEAPHVVFTPEIKSLAAQIIGSQTNPIVQAKAIFDWIGSNIQYSFAREYSTLTNISAYCLANHYGDCGQESLLFITLCRSIGIPARWQSGWDLYPHAHDIHDWSEVYLEPYGWIPVDPWAGLFSIQYCPALTPEERQELHDFYFGGLDFYRMAANADHSQTLSPPKLSQRSDDVDFQRGEVEWRDARHVHNIYFPDYSYNLSLREIP